MMTVSLESEISKLVNKYNFQHQLSNHYISLFCLHYYVSKNYLQHKPEASQLVRDFKVIKRFSSKINSILYQTNLSNVVIVNALRFYTIVIDHHHKHINDQDHSSTCVKFFYKNMQDNILIIFIVCLMISNKTYDDSSFTSKTWSNLSKFPLKKLNFLEIQILGSNILKFDVFHSSFHLDEFYNWSLYCVDQIEILKKLLITASGSSMSISSSCTSILPGRARTRLGRAKFNSRKMSINSLVSKESNPSYTTPLLSNNLHNSTVAAAAAAAAATSSNNHSFYSITPTSSHSANRLSLHGIAANPNSTFANVDPVTNSPSYFKSNTKQYGSNNSANIPLIQLYTPPLNDTNYLNVNYPCPKKYSNPVLPNNIMNYSSANGNTNNNGLGDLLLQPHQQQPIQYPHHHNLNFDHAYPTPEFNFQNCTQPQSTMFNNVNPLIGNNTRDASYPTFNSTRIEAPLQSLQLASYPYQNANTNPLPSLAQSSTYPQIHQLQRAYNAL